MDAIKAFVRRWRWPALGLLAACFVGMLIEVQISEYRPAPEGPVEVATLVVVGTFYMWLGLAIYAGIPLLVVVEAIRAWRRYRRP